MSKRIVTAVALLGAAGVISGCSLEQPSAGCIVQDSTDYPWQAVYVLKNGDAKSSCGQLKGEALGVYKYIEFEKGANERLTKKRAYIGIRPEGLASKFEVTYKDEVLNADGTVKVDDKGAVVMKDVTVERVDGARDNNYAIAKAATALSETLADEPDDKGLCATTGFKPASVTAKEVVREDEVKGETVVVAPAESLTYTFSDVKVYSDPSAPGTQLAGTLKYSDGPDCEAEYTVLALWPQVGCDPEAFANPTEENAADRCAEGSGLNPDFDAVCVEGIAGGDPACVPNPAKGVPAFKNK
ncbi:MAG TPA: hypothetical protein VFZ09_39735 [Archangium sp.]|uniref:hypothetical protein n=1 Tax=Archangium sp. TaxID=1872627 RepID=UPI002E366832|nr:hypothetical protein [Archangium sp.]HEX5752405.1 hypothetical protein [Archangium sp.]